MVRSNWGRRLLVLAATLVAACTSDTSTEPSLARRRPIAPMDVTENMTLIADRPFNVKSTGSAVEGWTNEEASWSNFTIVTDASAPKSPSNVAQVRYPAGFTGNNSPARAKINFSTQVRTVKSDIWVLLSPNFQGGGGSNATTVVSLNVGSSKRISFQAVGSGSGALAPAVYLFGDADARDRLDANVVPTAQVMRGAWQKWTVFVRASQAGVADGGINLYLDGVLVLSYNDVAIIPAAKTNYFNQFDWKPNWGESGDVVSQEMSMRWDHAATWASDSRLSDDPPPPPPADTSVASVTLTPEYDSVLVGASKQFTAVARDANGMVRAYAISWSSTAPQVATVDNVGLASGVAPGVATIVAAAGGKADSSSLTVYSSAPPPADTSVASVTVTPASAAILVGGTQQFAAVVKNAADSVLDRAVSWSSSAPSVATVSTSGLATGVAAGSASIIATVGSKADTSALTVSNPPPVVTTVTVTPATATKLVGETQQFSVSVLDQYGQPMAEPVSWSSTATSVATVSGSGLATGVSAGVASIIASAGGKADTSTFTVQNPPPVVTTVTVTPASASIQAGSTQQFSAVVRDQYGQTMGVSVAWSSSATGVATVNASGLATGVSAGSALIIASASGKADTSALTVTAPPPPPPGNAKYVAVNGTRTGNGSISQPWGLQYALSGAGGQIQPGDTIFIRGGVYDTTTTVGWDYGTRSGTASAPIVFSGYPGETPIIKKQFRGNGSYITIRKLTFEGPIDNGITNQVYLNNCHHITFTENEIRFGGANAGLSVDESHHMTITHNYIHDNGRWGTNTDHGIYYKTTTGPGSLIANNLLIHNAGRGLSMHDNSGAGVYDVVVAHNTIVANGSTGLLLNDGDRNTVVNNILVGNGDVTGQAQLRVQDGGSQVVHHNITWHATATSRRGIDNSGSSTSVIGPNLIADPLFVSFYSNLRLQAGSPAIGYSDSAFAQALDYLFLPRSSPVDAGAYEYR